MAIWWFNKTLACSTTAFAALFYYVIIVRNRNEKKETGSKLKCIYLIEFAL